MISVENVTKTYRTRTGPRLVLDGISLTVGRGERVGIMGRNGAGKSTFVRVVGGGEKPTEGVVRRTMSVSWPLAFTGAFQPVLTGLDNLRFVCRVYGVDAAKVQAFVEDFSELGVYMREPLHHYSSGMIARLAFAISLSIEFDCFLIDEVTGVGDERFHAKCRAELFEKRKDRAFIIVSHDRETIIEYCHRAVMLEAGRLHSFSSVAECVETYEQKVAAAAGI